MTDDGACNLYALSEQLGMTPLELARRLTPGEMVGFVNYYKRRKRENRS